MGNNKLTPKQQRAVEIVQEIGPVASVEVAKLMGCGQDRCLDHLRNAAKTGAISLTQRGRYALWFAPRDKDKAWAMVLAQLEVVKERRRARDRARYCLTKKRETKERAHEAWASAPPVHRRIPASEAGPIEIIGPVSVFALGAA